MPSAAQNLAEAIDGFINDRLTRIEARRKEGCCHQPKPAYVIVSPDAAFQLLNHDAAPLVSPIDNPTPDGPRWRLRGCNLPIVIDDTMTGHSFRIENADGVTI